MIKLIATITLIAICLFAAVVLYACLAAAGRAEDDAERERRNRK